VQLQPCLLLT